MTPRAFLARYWQKQPLLARGAIPALAALLSPHELQRLAMRDDAQSRVVIRAGRTFELHRGPFSRRFFKQLGRARWTLLVQDVNQFVPAARALLERFNFIPYARLDDLMVSYASAGGGVGPHCDSYDVFLLQGLGRRRWGVSRQRDLALLPDLPLKILRRFRPQHEWVLDAGDLLYLPPQVAHDGVALEACMTYSVGFRAPVWSELGEQLLAYLQDRVSLPGGYVDPGLKPQAHPARIPPAMLRAASAQLARVTWSSSDIERFLGSYLSEPKPHVFFDPPERPLARRAFERSARRHGVAVDLKTQMLYSGRLIFINGEALAARGLALERLRALANARALRLRADDRRLHSTFYAWYRAGWIRLAT
jgi:50S ribosomal protein L16 3-hydroxylase